MESWTTPPSYYYNLKNDDETKEAIHKIANSRSPISENYSYFGYDPNIDIIEERDRYVIEVEVPGLTEDDIKVVLRKNVLTITGKKNSTKMSDDDERVYIERSYGDFRRGIPLPSLVKPTEVTAKLENGILKITCVKKITDEYIQKEIKVKS